MIIKELDTFYGKTPWDFSGRKAEEDMAYYLKRRFYDRKSLNIINNLRFPYLDSYVQIDHLILCRYGAIIIESKSVRNKVKYEGEQWFRLWDNHWIGMKNPVLQAKEQGNALIDLLCQNAEKLRDKFLGLLQKQFGCMPVKCFVAISDTGMIIPPRTNNLYSEQVFKAEAISDKIEIYYKKLKSVNSLTAALSSKWEPWYLSEKELQRVIDFLLSLHVPYTPDDELQQENEEPFVTELKENMHLDPACGTQEQMTVLPPTPPIEPQQPLASFATQQQSDPIELQQLQTSVPQSNTQSNSNNKEQEILTYDKCPQCGGKIKILWGAKFKSYYWHCDSCGKNISINYKCPKCHEKLRIQKLGVDYYIYCIICGLQEHYFSDKE